LGGYFLKDAKNDFRCNPSYENMSTFILKDLIFSTGLLFSDKFDKSKLNEDKTQEK
jgi:hypothetical protein